MRVLEAEAKATQAKATAVDAKTTAVETKMGFDELSLEMGEGIKGRRSARGGGNELLDPYTGSPLLLLPEEDEEEMVAAMPHAQL